MGFANVCLTPPAKRSPTGLFPSDVTMSDPESQPALKASGVIEICPVNTAQPMNEKMSGW